MDTEQRLVQECLERLNALPSICATQISEPSIEAMEIDGYLTIHGSGQSVDYVYEVKSNVTGTTTSLIAAYLKVLEKKLGQKPLLITHYLSNPAVDRLVSQGIEFVDTAGNIYLNNPAAYVLVRGKPRPKEKPASGSKITATTLELIYILLKSPKMLDSPYRELANAAGVALGSIGNALKNLHQLGYLQRLREGSYRITNYIKLLERWEMGYAETLRPKLLLGTFTPTSGRSFSEVAQNIIQQAKDDNFLIGGELGAALATSYLHPQSATLHIEDNYRAIATKLRLKPSTQGEIIFIKQFGHQNFWHDFRPDPLADPLLIHAELLSENNDRLRETAERLFSKYIEDRQKNA